MQNERKTKWVIILAFASVYIIWGSTYFVLLIGLRNFPPFLLSGLRFLIAGIILFAWCIIRGKKIPDFSSIKINAVCGTLMLLGGTVSVAWAEQYISSSLAAIVVTSLPFWFVLLDKNQWSFYFSNKYILIGLVLGFAGVALLVGFDHSENSSGGRTGNQLAGILGILVGGIAWTIGSLYTKYKPTNSSLLVNGSIQLLSSGIFCLFVSLLTGEFRHFSFSNISVPSWMAVLYLASFGSIIAYLSYLYLLKMRPPALVSTYVYVNPIVALILGALLANEQITFMKVAGLVIILCGVLLVNLAKYALAVDSE